MTSQLLQMQAAVHHTLSSKYLCPHANI